MKKEVIFIILILMIQVVSALENAGSDDFLDTRSRRSWGYRGIQFLEGSDCVTLTVPNIIYKQNSDIISDQPICISIEAENVTYDCQGNSITSEEEHSTGIYSNSELTTIENCNIFMPDENGKPIVLENADNSYIYNNNLREGWGIILHETDNIKIINNNMSEILFAGIEGTGNNNIIKDNYIYYSEYYAIIFNGSNNIIQNNTLQSHEGEGIYLIGNENTINNNNIEGTYYNSIYLIGNENKILDNQILQSGMNGIFLNTSNNNNIKYNEISGCVLEPQNYDHSCIKLFNSNNNLIEKNTINDSRNNGIILFSTLESSNNIFKDMFLENIAETEIALEELGGRNLNNTFVNVTYGRENVHISSELIRKWYYKARILENSTPLVNASVIIYSSENFSDPILETMTNELGIIETELAEYISKKRTKIPINHTVIVNKEGYDQETHNIHITNNYEDEFTLTKITSDLEAVITYNPLTKKIEVTGNKENVSVITNTTIIREIIERRSKSRASRDYTKIKKLTTYTLQDEDNELIITLRVSDSRSRKRAKVMNLTYDGITIIPETTYMGIGTYGTSFPRILQFVYHKNKFAIRTDYKSYENETRVTILEDQERQYYTQQGLVLTELLTNKGEFEYNLIEKSI